MARTYVALDLETTGLSPRLDRMIEAGAVRFRDGEVLDTFQSFVRPEVGIPRAVSLCLRGDSGRLRRRRSRVVTRASSAGSRRHDRLPGVR